jgi:Bacterial TSP3 repeat
MSKLKVTLAVLFLLSVAGLLGFQNCANVGISKSQVEELSVSGSSILCLDNQSQLQNYTLETFYVRNINVIGWKGQFVADSDGDGLPDDVETAVGFDPTNPHSRSVVLDRVCFDASDSNSCPHISTNCSAVPSPLGISQCEIVNLGLDQLYQHPTSGLDSDKDGIIDYFEILGGTSPVKNDALADPDNDGILNQVEYQRQSNPLYSDANAPLSSLVQANAQLLTADQAPSCAGEAWNLSIDKLPYLATMAVTSSADPRGVFRSHSGAENVIAVVVKLKPKTGFTSSLNSKIYYQTLVVSPNRSSLGFDVNSFVLAGEVLP